MSNHNDINTGSYTAKTFAVEFTTGSNVNVGTQDLIYEQGGGTRGINVYIYQGKVYAGVWNRSTWGVKHLNTTVQANTSYYVVIVYNSPNIEVFVNGSSIGTINDAGSLTSHSGGIGVKGMNGSTYFHNGGSSGSTNYDFPGSIAEIIEWNTAMSGSNLSDLHTYLGC